MRLAGKVAIVTGGAGGIGRAYARRLAAEGAAVIVADLVEAEAERTVEAIRSAGGEATAAFLDQADPERCREMAAIAARTYGGIDVLVNNAALFSQLERKPVWEIDPDEWDRVMAVNLKGPFLCAMAVFPYMKERGGGKIINIASASIFSARNQLAHYVASKAGLVGLTRALARELGPFNICVNTVSPGSTASGAANVTPEYLQSRVGNRCLQRVQTPADLEGTILFLASSDSDFLTGQHIVVDGGAVFQ